MMPAGSPVDLTSCETEPIHIPGSIQPHGVLLAVDETHWRVMVVSRNAGELLGRPVPDLLGAPLSAVLGEGPADAVRQHVTGVGPDAEGAGVPLRLGRGVGRGAWVGRAVEALMHRSGALLVVEIEPDLREPSSPQRSDRAAQAALTHLAATTTVAGLAHALAAQVRNLTGHDRVMVYRFDEDWNGEVIAEDRREDLEPLLGLHYPAGDIPAQARRLYATSWTRVIADVAAEPSPLVHAGAPGRQEPLDLSLAALRSVSPVHIEYLTNMGVRASMSISLIQDGRLWGLVACHHYSGPRCPTHDARWAAEFVGQAASQLLRDRQAGDDRAERAGSAADLAQLTEHLARDPRPPLEALADHPELLMRLTDATGIVLGTSRRLMHLGLTPDDATVRRIVRLLPDEESGPWRTDHLVGVDAALGCDQAAGAMLVRDGGDAWLLWLRTEVERAVDWGGDPHAHTTSPGDDGPPRLGPRRSFARWRQVVRGRSLPWRTWQVDAAERLGATVAATLARRSQEQLAVVSDLHDVLGSSALPTVQHLELYADLRPAHGGYLGGDWWDVLPLPDGRHVALVLGDVAGHGVAAAATMTQVRISLRAHVVAGSSPAQVLQRLDALVSHLHPDDLVTALVALLDVGTGHLQLARAGAPMPILAGPDDLRELPVPARPPLGVGLDVDVPPLDLVLAPGTSLVMFSDGLIERRDSSLTEGIAHVLAAAGAHLTGDLSTWGERLLGATPGRAPDDTTLLIARRTL